MRRERGFLLLAALALVVVLGFFAAVIGTLSLGNIQSGADQLSAAQALFLAEAGLERAAKRMSTPPLQSCATFAPDGPHALGKGTFTVLSATASGNECLIRSQGQVGTAVRTIEGAPGVNLSTPFTNSSEFAQAWPPQYVPGKNKGTIDFSTESKDNDGTGSMAAITNVGRNEWIDGYVEASLATPLTGSQDVTVSLWAKMDWVQVAPKFQEFSVELITPADVVYSVGTVAGPDNSNTWASYTFSYTIPAGVTVNRVRFHFNLQNANNVNAQTWMWVDNVQLYLGSVAGGGVPNALRSWSEVFP